jgi:hypothetical protein
MHSPYVANVYESDLQLHQEHPLSIDIGCVLLVNASSLKKFRHLEYIYVNVLYIYEAHRWSDEHAVSCLFTRYTWPSRWKIAFLNRWN